MSCIFLGYQIQGRREFAKNKVVETTRENQPGDGNLKETTRAEDSSAPEAANIRKLNLIGGQGEKIGVSLPNQFRERWTRFSKYFSETLKAAGYTPMVSYALKRPDKQIFQEPELTVDKIAAQQIADLKTLYEEGCKVIFVAPVEVSSLQ
jgi:putative multiple sugar transport system substrate-binding protein